MIKRLILNHYQILFINQIHIKYIMDHTKSNGDCESSSEFVLESSPMPESENFMDSIPWDLGMIFDFIEGGRRGLCTDGVIYYDRTLHINFGPFLKGHKCNICVKYSPFGKDYKMYVDCDRRGNGGELFVLMWNHIPACLQKQ